MTPSTSTTGQPSAPAGSRRLIAWNFMALSAASLAGRLVGLFTGIYTRRTLGVEAIGQLNWCNAFISYFNMFINPGLETIAKRDVAREPRLAGRTVSLLLTLQLLLATGAFVLVGVIAMLGLRGPQISAILALQAIGLLLLPLNLTWLLQARERMAPAAFAEVVSQALMLPAVILFIHSPAHVLRYVLLAYPLRLGVIVYLVWYARRRGLFQWSEIRLALAGASPLLKAAIPVGLSQVSVLLYYNFATLFLGFKQGDAAVGLYSTAFQLMMVPMFLSGALTSAYFPALARAMNDTDQCRKVSREFLRVLVWIGLPIAAAGWAAGRHVIHLMYGAQFAESGLLFEWLSLNVALVFFNIGIAQPFIAWNLQNTHLKLTLAAGTLNVVLNTLLIPRYGATGAVFTALSSEMVVLVGALFLRRRIAKIPVLAIVSRPLVLSVALAAVIRGAMVFGSIHWMIAVALGLALFGVCFWICERETVAKLARGLWRSPKST